jgi:tetratricopeptide (TPR) repeat protein
MGHHEQAAIAYDQARQIGLPWRMLWYQFGPFQAYYETGRYQELIQLADATISSGGEIEEVYFWKGRALVALDNTAGATEAWRQALTIKPTYIEAQAALASIN